jgi:4-azaleucine resistance transporter AzlC
VRIDKNNDPDRVNHSSFAARCVRDFLAGCRDTLPLEVGAIPFGLLFGALAVESGLSAAGAMAMSALVFAGSAQFIALGLLAAGTVWPLIVLTTLVVNVRHLLYAASLAPYVRQLPRRWQIPLAFGLTDETFVLVANRYRQAGGGRSWRWYYLGSAGFMYVNWQLWTWVGLMAGRLMPKTSAWGLDFVMPVTFIGLVIPYLKSKPMGVTIIVAGGVALLADPLPNKLGLLLAALAGVMAGVGVEALLTGKDGKSERDDMPQAVG